MRVLARKAIELAKGQNEALGALQAATEKQIRAVEADRGLTGQGRIDRLNKIRRDADASALAIMQGLVDGLDGLEVQAAEESARAAYNVARAIPAEERTALTMTLAPLIQQATARPLLVVDAWIKRFHSKPDRILLEDLLDSAADAGITDADDQGDDPLALNKRSFPAWYLKKKDQLLPRRPPAEQAAHLDLQAATELPGYLTITKQAMKKRIEGLHASAWLERSSLSAAMAHGFSTAPLFEKRFGGGNGDAG